MSIMEKLKEAATRVRENAYAPYSKFKVGAAIWANETVFTGCNVENVSYPVGMCAERVAIGNMIAQGVKEPQAIVIVAGPLITPCGMCRQALAEFAKDIPVLLVSLDAQIEQQLTLGKLLPGAFTF